MKHFRILIILLLVISSTACSSSERKVTYSESDTINDYASNIEISAEDQKIIDDYKKKFNSLDHSDNEVVNKVMKDSLVEIAKIKNDYEREKLQFNIYLALEMYEDAFQINNKMMKKSFSVERLLIQCELIYYTKRSKKEYEKCNTELAEEFKKELVVTSKNNPEYIFSEWGYWLYMFKSGHKEYESKLKEKLNSIKDEQLKFQLQASYELAVEQIKSYE